MRFRKATDIVYRRFIYLFFFFKFSDYCQRTCKKKPNFDLCEA
jgi:hypothetical protein